MSGFYYVGKDRVACQNRFCATCNTQQLFFGYRSFAILHHYFIPIAPVGIVRRWFCSECSTKFDEDRPSAPWILICGIAFCVYATVVGTKFFLQKTAPEAGLFWMVAGPAGIVWFTIKIRRENHRAYIERSQQVIGLTRTTCPVCQGPILPGTRPRCHSCNLELK